MTADDSSEVEITILMPCLNEARTVAGCVRAARDFIESRAIAGEVLVADNGSTDGSQELAAAAGARVVRVPKRGYGAALMSGIASARGRFVVMGDADSSYDFSNLDEFLARLRGGADLVMGNRFRGGIDPGAMPLIHRYLGNPVLSFIGRLFFRVPIGDFHCGLRGFSRASIHSLGLVTPGMEFASEMVAKSAMAGLRIEEVPTVLRRDGRGRASHLRTWRDGWRHLRFLLLFCPRWLFLYPGLLLLGFGLSGFVVLGRGPLNFVAIGFDVHSLLYMGGATVLGMQLIQLAFLTKWMAVMARLVPLPRWMSHTQGWVSIESGIVAGGTMLLGGMVWSASLVGLWQDAGFGALDPRETMRSAIPAVTLMVVGMQAAAGALFAGALQALWRSGDRA
ncbi:MAG: glycosyltransferase family 2 protein [Pseudomonadota bacterium]